MTSSLRMSKELRDDCFAAVGLAKVFKWFWTLLLFV